VHVNQVDHQDRDRPKSLDTRYLSGARVRNQATTMPERASKRMRKSLCLELARPKPPRTARGGPEYWGTWLARELSPQRAMKS
jgi:hypothetical protein